MTVEPEPSPRAEERSETRKLMFVFNGEPMRTGRELVIAMRQDWRRATKLLKDLSDPELASWLGARPDGDMLMRALRGDRDGAARFLRLQAEFDPGGVLEFRGRVISDATILAAGENASHNAEVDSHELTEDVTWLQKIREQRILLAIAAAVDDSGARTRLRADGRLHDWTLQAQTALDKCVTAWVYVVTGVDVQPPPFTAASLQGKYAGDEQRTRQREIEAARLERLTPMQAILRTQRFDQGHFARSDAGDFCTHQLSLWTTSRELEAELRSNIMQHQDSPQAVAMFRSLIEALPEVSDYNFEMLIALEKVASRSGEQLGRFVIAAFNDNAEVGEADIAIAAASELKALVGADSVDPQSKSSPVPHSWTDASHEARTARFREWVSSLTKGLKSPTPTELGTVITTRMIIEALLAGRDSPKSSGPDFLSN